MTICIVIYIYIYIMIIKLSVQQDNKDKWHVFASENRASKYMKQKKD